MITINKVMSKLFMPEQEHLSYMLMTKKKYGERAVLLTAYEPTDISYLYEHFEVERLVRNDPKSYPYPRLFVESYKIKEKGEK